MERSVTEMDEMDVRNWFARVPLEQARDTYRVVEGILQVRMEAQPLNRSRTGRAVRKDAGAPRVPVTMPLIEQAPQAALTGVGTGVYEAADHEPVSLQELRDVADKRLERQ